MIDSAKLIRWYDFQAPFYRLWRNDYDSPLVARVVALAGEHATAKSVLDAGCGTGLFTIGLARSGREWSVQGLDASEGMLAVAARQAARQGRADLRFHRGDVTALPFPDGVFDVAVAAGLMPCLNDRTVALGELRRVLAGSGRLISVEFDRDSMSLPLRLFFHVMIFGFKTVTLFRPGFRYARRWNIETSTIDLPLYETELRDAGLRLLSTDRLSGHVVYHLSRDDA